MGRKRATPRRRPGRPVVEVIWEDAVSQEQWAEAAGIVAFRREQVLVVTVGLLVERSKRYVVVASSHSSLDHHGGLWKIPTGMVRSVRQIGRSRRLEIAA